MNTLNMCQIIEDEICRHLDLFEKWFKDRTFYNLSRPEVVFAPLTIDAGQCIYDWTEMDYVIGNIIINIHILTPENFETIIKQVVPHETAHWCHAVLHGYINDEEQNLEHGTQWQQLMKFFEADDKPQICGLNFTPAIGLKQYACDCCVVNLDDFDQINYAEDLFCPHCKKDYKPLTKEKNEEDYT